MLKHLFFCVCILTAFDMSAQYGWTDAEIYFKDGTVLSGLASLPMENSNYSVFGKSNEKVKFKSAKKEKTQKFEAKEIDQIIFEISYEEKIDKKRVKKLRSATYIPIYFDEKKKKQGFAELIVDGKVQLVGRTVSYTSSTMVHDPVSVGVNGDMIYFPPVYHHYSGIHNSLLLVREGHNAITINQVSLFKAFKERASQFFEDCPSLVAKIENKEFKKEDLISIVEYYNSNCAK